MKEEIGKILAEAEQAGTLEEKVRLLWGSDGCVVLRLGERAGWHRAHRVVQLKIAAAFFMGVGAITLLRALL
jgi:hypothetical protein